MTKAGDTVKVITDEEEVIGILMPRPELLEKGYTIIKLYNGYNIGIDDQKIKKIELVKKYSPKVPKKKPIKTKKGLPTVAILSTGGTISSKVDYRTGGAVADYTAEDFVEMCPELLDIANIKTRKVMAGMSEDYEYKDWSVMARAISKEITDVDGMVITTGTDTLHNIACALSFFLKDLGKPVVITAAQRSIDRGSSDAYMNLICAVTAAAKSDIAGVVTCLHGTSDDEYCILNRGTKVRKMHTSRRDAFRPINEQPLAKVYLNGKIEVTNKNYTKRFDSKVTVDDKFEQKTAIILIYPGMDPTVIDHYIDKGYKGLVISATALGHVPQKVYPNIKKATDKGVTVVIASQTLYGRVHPLVYAALRNLSIELKCIFAEDMLPETAYVKLGWILAKEKEAEKIKQLMITNIAREINPRIQEDSFLV